MIVKRCRQFPRIEKKQNTGSRGKVKSKIGIISIIYFKKTHVFKIQNI